ncbi:flagellar biosynthesis anti-sigma factor FlgM [Cellvibrio sp. NN19]|uniref:flagellar biosynthesis anti-sigma factor FlgM n=1 Tax=Cellvibrio chitinivorans TaxID=3102792 RepID=UPI002B4072CF|nr:flagellar biosynthesis anti-sigma factor FlgM [Cellvibrio sp. NN19]
MILNTNNTLDSVSTKGTRSKPAAPNTPETKTPEAAPASKAAGDQVVLSQEAQNLGRLQAKIESSPDVDMDKVAEIRRAIAEGRFEINPERIAENMLNQDELLG